MTLTILECLASDAEGEIARLGSYLGNLIEKKEFRQIIAKLGAGETVLDEGESTALDENPIPDTTIESGEAGYGAILFVERRPPNWLKEGDLEDVKHDIAIWFSRDRFVAIRANGFLADAIQKWLDGSPAPSFRRISPVFLEGEVLSGEIKNLWLRGVHSRRNTLADTKYLSGPRVQDALGMADSTFAVGAGRADIVLDSSRPNDVKAVGCSPTKSTVWLKMPSTFDELRDLTLGILGLIANAVVLGSIKPPLPWLASRLVDLTGVYGAYELATPAVADIVAGAGQSPDLEAAAELLEEATLGVLAIPGSPDFLLEVGRYGRIGGTLRGRVNATGGRVGFTFGFEGNPSDISLVRPVLDALRFSELITVHYESGHTVTSEAIWSGETDTVPFPNWQWKDFSGYSVDREKPVAQNSEVRLALIGDGETSLFSWVQAHLSRGYLACDDGSGEVADFVHVDSEDDMMTLVHVKGAESDHPQRGIAAGKYEGVAGQATKNLLYLDSQRLVGALGSGSRVESHPCWLDGERVDNRREMLDYLSVRSARARNRVVIVQPHVTKARYEAEWDKESPKVKLLDTILNTARAAAVALGADLEVWGDLGSGTS